MRILAVLVVPLLVALASCQVPQTLCAINTNYAPPTNPTLAVYNAGCGDPAYPYCTGHGLCAECSPIKNDDECDCPANFRCVAYQFNPVRKAAFCAPLPIALYGRKCKSTSDCGVELPNVLTGETQTAYYGTCREGVCVYCNPQAENTRICKQEEVSSGDPGLYGSTAEGRACFMSSLAWNSLTWPLQRPVPNNTYEYERDKYAPGIVTDIPTTDGPDSQQGSARALLPALGVLCALCVFLA